MVAGREDQRLKAQREAEIKERTPLKILLDKMAKGTLHICDLPAIVQNADKLTAAQRDLVVAYTTKMILEGHAANEKLQENNKELQETNKELQKTNKEFHRTNTRLTESLNDTKTRLAEEKIKSKKLERTGVAQQQTCAALEQKVKSTEVAQQQTCAALEQKVKSLTLEVEPLHGEIARLTALLSENTAALDAANSAKDEATAANESAKVSDTLSVKHLITLALDQLQSQFDKEVEDTQAAVKALQVNLREATDACLLINIRDYTEKLEVAMEALNLAICARDNMNSMSPERKDKLVGVAAANLKMNAAGIKKKASESNAPAPEQSAAKEPMSFASVANGTWPSLSDQHTAKAKALSGNASPLIGKANDKGFTVGDLVQVDNKTQGLTTSVTVTFLERTELYEFFTRKHQSSDDNSKTSAAAEFQTFCKTYVWPKLSEPNNKAIIDQVNVMRDRRGYPEITETTVYFCSGSLTAESVTIYLNYNRNKSSTKHSSRS